LIRMPNYTVSRIATVGAIGLLTTMLTAESAAAQSASDRPQYPDACLRYIPEAEHYYRIPKDLLLAVAYTESRLGSVPWPWTLNVAGRAIYATDYWDASRLLADKRLMSEGNVDVGCMQISLTWHGADFPNKEAALHPRNNVWYAAQMLYKLRRQEGNWTAAVALYHSHNGEKQRDYVCKVLQAHISLGYNTISPEARRYCSGLLS